jgi:molybdopterin converting factor small subunit
MKDKMPILRAMPKVSFTYALKRFFPGIGSTDVDAENVRDTLDTLEQTYPGLKGYILDDQGRVRQHVNIFVDGELIADRETLSDTVNARSDVYVMQALSGG